MEEAWRDKHPQADITLYLDVEDSQGGTLFTTLMHAHEPGGSYGSTLKSRFSTFAEVEAWLIEQRIETCTLVLSVYKLERALFILPCAARAHRIHLQIYGPHSSVALTQFLQAASEYAPVVKYIGLHDLDLCLRRDEVMDALAKFKYVEDMTMQLEYGRRHMDPLGQEAIVRALPRFIMLKSFAFNHHVKKETLELLYTQIPRCPRLGCVRAEHPNAEEMNWRFHKLSAYNVSRSVRAILALLLPHARIPARMMTPYLLPEHIRLLLRFLGKTQL